MTKNLHGTPSQGDNEFEFTAQGVRLTVMSGVVPLANAARAAVIPGTPHTHSWYELFYILSGEVCCRFGSEYFVLREGEMLLIPPGVPHYTDSSKEGAERYVFNFSCTLTREIHRDGGAAELFRQLLDVPGYYRFRPDKACEHSAVQLGDALEKGASLLAGTYLWTLLLHIGNLTARERTPASDMLADSSISRIYKLEQIFSNYYRCDFPLTALAEEMHLSARQLSRIIRRQYGCTYREKINAMRIIAATHLLISTNKGIAEVAEDVGYRSVACFQRAFRREHGCLPAEYKMKKGEEQ